MTDVGFSHSASSSLNSYAQHAKLTDQAVRCYLSA